MNVKLKLQQIVTNVIQVIQRVVFLVIIPIVLTLSVLAQPCVETLEVDLAVPKTITLIVQVVIVFHAIHLKWVTPHSAADVFAIDVIPLHCLHLSRSQDRHVLPI